MVLGAVALSGALLGVGTGTAGSQSTRLRLAAPTDCATNVQCIPGFQRVYHLDPTSLWVRLKVADAGIQALDNGIAEVAVAFSSDPELSRPVANLTHDQIQGIIAGQITSWSQIPGSTRSDAIVPVGLVPTAGAASVFESVFVDFGTPVAWQPLTFAAETQVRDYLEQTPGGFGYLDLALVGPLHVIDYEGIGCTRQTVENGSYPGRATLGVLTRGRPSGALARFLHWAHTSPVARRVIATHYVPG